MVELVTVDVVVTDKQGNPVTGLEGADFTLSEEGVPQAITSFEAVTGQERPSSPPPRSIPGCPPTRARPFDPPGPS